MAKLTRIAILTLLIVSVSGAGYCVWALQRVTDWTLAHEEDVIFPRDPPYPDHLIMWLNDWYDQRFPVSPGYIKLHSELARVRCTFRIFFCVFAGSAIIWASFLLGRSRFQRTLSLSDCGEKVSQSVASS